MKIDFLESFDHYLTLPREQAYNEFMDEKNLRIFRVMLLIFAIISGVAVIVNIAMHQSLNAALLINIFNLLALLFLRFRFSSFFSLSNIRRAVIVFTIVQAVVFTVADLTFPQETDKQEQASGKEGSGSDSAQAGKKGLKFGISVNEKDEDSYGDIIFLLCLTLLIFKLPRHQIYQLYAGVFVIPLLIAIPGGASFSSGDLIQNFVIGMVMMLIAVSNDRSRQKKFCDHYDFQHRKNFESIRMKRELNHAREIQLSMLPESDAVINDIGIAGISIPASEVGGDYFDYFRISDNETGVFICDVSGHGVASGLMLSALRSSMHLILDDTTNPKTVVEKLNKMIRKTQSRKMFVTAVLAIIDTSVSKCRLYNAGHLPPYRISGEAGEIFRIRKHGIALGAMGTVDRSESDNLVTFDFRKGDKIVFYTDGVTEAMNSSREEYGLERFEMFINANSVMNAKQLLEGIVADVRKFSGTSEQRDDLSLLIIERL